MLTTRPWPRATMPFSTTWLMLSGPCRLMAITWFQRSGVVSTKFMNFVDTTPDLWNQVIAINLHGPLNMSHVVLKGMVARGQGRVVNIASDAGRVGSSLEAVYSACKGGIIAFTKTVAREVARKGITLNTVCPGPTDTPLLAAV